MARSTRIVDAINKWVAVKDDEVLVAAGTPTAVLARLARHDEKADTMFRVPDALGQLLASAPIDDEPPTPDEDVGAAEAREQIAGGEVFVAEDIRREFP